MATEKRSEYQILQGKFGRKQKQIAKLEKEVNDLFIASTSCTDPDERQSHLLTGSSLRQDLQELRRELDRIHYAMYHRNYYV